MALLALVKVACVAQAPTFDIAPGHEGAPGVARVLLAPTNLAIGLRPALEVGVEPVQQEIVAYLEAHGREVERLTLIEGRRVWEEAVARVKESGATLGFEVAAAEFVRKLGESREFDALVLPSLVQHRVRVKHRKASWDGVKRRIDVVNMPHPTAGRSDNLAARGMIGLGMAGDATVSSLYVVVVARGGERVFAGRGGLEFIEELEVEDVDRSYRVRMRTRGAALQDRAILREGIEIAFDPYLSPPTER
jgi:hypothetical protein